MFLEGFHDSTEEVVSPEYFPSGICVKYVLIMLRHFKLPYLWIIFLCYYYHLFVVRGATFVACKCFCLSFVIHHASPP
jgi:hypothetical protein